MFVRIFEAALEIVVADKAQIRRLSGHRATIGLLVAALTISFGIGDMRRRRQRLFIGHAMRIVTTSTMLDLRSNLSVDRRQRTDRLPVARQAEGGHVFGQGPRCLGAMLLVADETTLLGKRLVERRARSEKLGLRDVAGRAGLVRVAAPEQRRTLGIVRIVTGKATSHDSSGVRSFVLAPDIAVAGQAQVRRRRGQDQVLSESVAPVAGAAVILRHRVVNVPLPEPLNVLLMTVLALSTRCRGWHQPGHNDPQNQNPGALPARGECHESSLLNPVETTSESVESASTPSIGPVTETRVKTSGVLPPM
jgi:hypothetical protein